MAVLGIFPDMHPCGMHPPVYAPCHMYPPARAPCTHLTTCTRVPYPDSCAGTPLAPGRYDSFERCTGQNRRSRAQGHARCHVWPGASIGLGYTGSPEPEMTRNIVNFTILRMSKVPNWPIFALHRWEFCKTCKNCNFIINKL